MKYLNQLEYPSIPYPTDISHPGSPLNSGSVKEAGCGLCCLAMAVDRLTDQSVSLKKLVSLSVKHKANLLPGTDMEILGPVVARQFHLEYSTTESVRTAVRCLKRGGCVIANVGETGRGTRECSPMRDISFFSLQATEIKSVSWIRLSGPDGTTSRGAGARFS